VIPVDFGIALIEHQLGVEIDDVHGVHMKAPSGQWVIGKGDPTHQRYGHPGHIYSMRPDLTSRSAGGLIFALKAMPYLAAPALAYANFKAIESAPEEEQRGLWQMFSSGLTGTFGIGSGLDL